MDRISSVATTINFPSSSVNFTASSHPITLNFKYKLQLLSYTIPIVYFLQFTHDLETILSSLRNLDTCKFVCAMLSCKVWRQWFYSQEFQLLQYYRYSRIPTSQLLICTTAFALHLLMVSIKQRYIYIRWIDLLHLNSIVWCK